MATFCLIHGAWHEPSCWDELTPRLMERGHEVAVPDLPLQDPEAGPKGPAATGVKQVA